MLLDWLARERLLDEPPGSPFKPLVQNSWNLVNDRCARGGNQQGERRGGEGRGGGRGGDSREGGVVQAQV